MEQLISTMESVESGNLSPQTEEYYGEMAILSQKFNHMVRRIEAMFTEAKEQEREKHKMEMLALQSQINPHFYYNTLASIIVLAEKERKEEVITICRNLTRMMRYITGSSNAPVTLREEMDYVRKYLYCMKVRFQENLNYTIEVDESILDVPVPKLIIQPIVENALKYGRPDGQVWISASCEQEEALLKVCDDGDGIAEERSGKNLAEGFIR